MHVFIRHNLLHIMICSDELDNVAEIKLKKIRDDPLEYEYDDGRKCSEYVNVNVMRETRLGERGDQIIEYAIYKYYIVISRRGKLGVDVYEGVVKEFAELSKVLREHGMGKVYEKLEKLAKIHSTLYS